MAESVDLSPSEILTQMIQKTSKMMMDSSIETDQIVGQAVEKGLRSAVRKISASFDEQIERIRSN
jgi:hypothetical protein